MGVCNFFNAVKVDLNSEENLSI